MDRGKAVARKTENHRNQLYNFNRGREALFCKANDFAAQHNAEVGIIVFSNNDEMFHHCSENSSLGDVVDRYKNRANYRPSFGRQIQLGGPLHGDLGQLRDEINRIGQSLQFQTHGDNWNRMKIEDMNTLEQELRSAIMEVQVRKDQLIQQELHMLQKKGHELAEENERMYHLIRNHEGAQQQRQNHHQHQELVQPMMTQPSDQQQSHEDVLNQFPFLGEEQPSIVLHLATLPPQLHPNPDQQKVIQPELEDQSSFFRRLCSDVGGSLNLLPMP